MSEQKGEPRKLLVIDFDGVINSYTSGWKGADVIPDLPVAGAFEFLSRALERFDVAIFSSRSTQDGGIMAMKTWFGWHGWPMKLGATGFEEPEGLLFPTEKGPAWLTIDDRCVRFEGTWPAIDALDSFVPWRSSGSRLLRCPFCGAEAEIKMPLGGPWIRCTRCRAASGLCSNVDDAVAAWNRRAG